jgi:hypothetical protein
VQGEAQPITAVGLLERWDGSDRIASGGRRPEGPCPSPGRARRSRGGRRGPEDSSPLIVTQPRLLASPTRAAVTLAPMTL